MLSDVKNANVVNSITANNKKSFWILVNIVIGLLFIILLAVSANAPYELDLPSDIEENPLKYPDTVFYLSNLQTAKMGGYFFLIFYLFSSLFYSAISIKKYNSYNDKTEFYFDLFAILFIPLFFSLFLRYKEYQNDFEKVSANQYLESQKSKNFLKFGKENLFLTISAFTLLTIMIFYKVLDLIGFDKSNPTNPYFAEWSNLITWPFDFVTSFSNHAVLIYIIAFIFFRKYKILDSNLSAIFAVSYLTFVGLIYNIILLPDFLAENPSWFPLLTNVVCHILSVVFSIVFLISLIYSRRKLITHNKFSYLKNNFVVVAFGIPYVIYVFIVPYILNYSMYTITNLNPNAWVLSGGQKVFGTTNNVLWIFLSIFILIVITSIYCALESLFIFLRKKQASQKLKN